MCWNELIETEVSVCVFIAEITVGLGHFNWVSDTIFAGRTKEISFLCSVLLMEKF